MPSPRLRAPRQRDALGLTPELELAARLDPHSPHRAALAAVDAEQQTALYGLTLRAALRAARRGDTTTAVNLIHQAQTTRR